MLRRVLLAALLVASAAAPLAVPAGAQSSSETRFDLAFTLNPTEGTVDAELSVADPGNLVELRLNFGNLDRLEGDPTLDGAWTWEDGEAVADLRETPNPTAAWTGDGRINVQTLEGEGHTSYVGEEFTILRAGQMVPGIRYRFPQSSPPTFSTQFTVNAPDGWEVDGPWERTAGTFETGSPIPRGFLAADDDLERMTLGHEEVPYKILRVEGAQEDKATETILLEARDFLGGMYGDVAHQRLIVVGPDPMFRGGLASPDGVFLHAEAGQSVVAHEMVHAYQSWDFSRAPADATVWVAEGLAEVHGKLLEVAAEVATRQEAVEYLERQHDTAREKHGVALSSVVYGSEHEQAAYTKGAVVITALNEAIRNATSNEYTLADVLKHINQRTAEEGRSAWGPDKFNNTDFRQAIGAVTGFSFKSFFDQYVHAAEVPRLGSIFPGEISVRILGTDPDPGVAGEATKLFVALNNLDTSTVDVDEPVTVDGEEVARIQATLGAGESAETNVTLPSLARGNYTVRVLASSHKLVVRGPPVPNATIEMWPQSPKSDQNVTVGVVIANEGETPYAGPARVTLDGGPILQQDGDVAPGASRTFSRTLAPLPQGEHTVRVLAPNGTVLAERAFTVAAPDPPSPPPDEEPGGQESPAAGAVLAVTLLAAVAGLARARRRT